MTKYLQTYFPDISFTPCQYTKGSLILDYLSIRDYLKSHPLTKEELSVIFFCVCLGAFFFLGDGSDFQNETEIKKNKTSKSV